MFDWDCWLHTLQGQYSLTLVNKLSLCAIRAFLASISHKLKSVKYFALMQCLISRIFHPEVICLLI